MRKLSEEVVGAPPPGLGGLDIAQVMANIGKLDQHARFCGEESDPLEQLHCGLVAGDSPGDVAKLLVGVSEAVPGLGRAPVVTKTRLQVEGFLAVLDRGRMLAPQGEKPTDRVERHRLPGLM